MKRKETKCLDSAGDVGRREAGAGGKDDKGRESTQAEIPPRL